MTDPNHVAYILASIEHESQQFSDLTEDYNGDPVKYFTKKYWDNVTVRKDLGNKRKADAYNFRGRGFIQVTGRDLYTRLGIRSDPDRLVRDRDFSAEVAVRGLRTGLFTGRSLAEFDDPAFPGGFNFIQARRAVNRLDATAQIGQLFLAYRNLMR